jgi:Predicted acetyltransferase
MHFVIVEQIINGFSEKETIKLFVEGNEVGYIAFTVNDDVLEIRHTVIYLEFRGKGYAKSLVDSVIDIAKSRNLKLTSSCSYANKIIDK